MIVWLVLNQQAPQHEYGRHPEAILSNATMWNLLKSLPCKTKSVVVVRQRTEQRNTAAMSERKTYKE